MTHQALVARLEGAEAGSRELDAHVEVAVRAIEADRTGLAREHWATWTVSRDFWVEDPHTAYQPAPVTTSLDAALSLAERVLPGWCVQVCQNRHTDAEYQKTRGWSVWFEPSNETYVDHDTDREAVGPTAALTTCAAVLKAIIAKGEPR